MTREVLKKCAIDFTTSVEHAINILGIIHGAYFSILSAAHATIKPYSNELKKCVKLPYAFQPPKQDFTTCKESLLFCKWVLKTAANCYS